MHGSLNPALHLTAMVAEALADGQIIFNLRLHPKIYKPELVKLIIYNLW